MHAKFNPYKSVEKQLKQQLPELQQGEAPTTQQLLQSKEVLTQLRKIIALETEKASLGAMERPLTQWSFNLLNHDLGGTTTRTLAKLKTNSQPQLPIIQEGHTDTNTNTLCI